MGDRVGVSKVTLSEHHGDPAGFMPAPITMAAAVLACTTRVTATLSALLVPLHDPVRIAEQLATLACLAPGRIEAVLGAGYRRAEFAMAGVERAQRGKLVEECYEVCLRAWAGEPFTWRGREVLVTPVPDPGYAARLAIGGKTEVAARRAALWCTVLARDRRPGARRPVPVGVRAARSRAAARGLGGETDGTGVRHGLA